MKKIMLCAFLLLVLFSQPGFAKSYSYDYVKTNLDINKDGSVVVRQERDYNFVGSFSYAYLDILKKGSANVRFLGIIDLDTNESLNYDLQEDSSHVKATWHYSATDTVKRFLIVYKIDGVIKRYEDVAEFYWKVIEETHERIDRLDSFINLPQPSPNLFKVFVHSSASPGKIEFAKDYSSADVTMQSIPSDTFVEFRVLLDPKIFIDAPQLSEKRYEAILNEERFNFYFSSMPFLPLLFAIIPIIALIYFYLKYGRDPKVDYQLNYEQEPPSNLPPMALSNLLEGDEGISQNDIRREALGLIGTIFDLARNGYIEISEEEKKGFLGIKKIDQVFILTKKGKEALKQKSLLKSFERRTLDFIFGCGQYEGRVTSSEIVKFCLSKRIEARNEIKSIDKDSRSWFEKNYFPLSEKVSIDKKRMFQVAIILILISSLATAVFLRFMNIINEILVLSALAVFITSILAFFLSGVISRRTYESALEVKKWKAFKNYITDFSAMKDASLVLLKLWDEYLVYAITLGVAKKLLENLKDLSILTGKPIHAVTWYHGISPMPGKMISPDNITTFVDNLSNTVNALSSSSSVGGGFSGGGGGGGGGGSSGAG